jgi:hypothetical protein
MDKYEWKFNVLYTDDGRRIGIVFKDLSYWSIHLVRHEKENSDQIMNDFFRSIKQIEKTINNNDRVLIIGGDFNVLEPNKYGHQVGSTYNKIELQNDGIYKLIVHEEEIRNRFTAGYHNQKIDGKANIKAIYEQDRSSKDIYPFSTYIAVNDEIQRLESRSKTSRSNFTDVTMFFGRIPVSTETSPNTQPEDLSETSAEPILVSEQEGSSYKISNKYEGNLYLLI